MRLIHEQESDCSNELEMENVIRTRSSLVVITNATSVLANYKFTAIVILRFVERCVMESNRLDDTVFLRGLLDSEFQRGILDAEAGYGLYTSAADIKEAEWLFLDDRNLNRYFETLDVIPDLPSSAHVLEIGAGPSHMSILVSRNSECHITVCDLPEAIGFWGNRYAELGFQSLTLDLASPPYAIPNEQFDLVLLCEVVEHLTLRPSLVLENIRHCLKPGGYIIVTTPNVAGLRSLYMILRGRSIHPPLDAIPSGSSVNYPHIREYTLSEMAGEMYRSGYELIHYAHLACSDRVIRGDPSSVLRKILTMIHPSFCSNLILLGQKRVEQEG
jgi:2-polyprenyl-3-methyl-5-hydroxy-6-metoxy-1,4-benzoquinol methylase